MENKTVEDLKKLFEEKFGIDQNRNRQQWKALVKHYGYAQVMKSENMTCAEIKLKCKK